MAVLHLTKDDFEKVITENETVLVDFWASWCGPCRMLGPIIDEIANERPDITVAKVNVDEEEELAAQFEVMSIPTVIIFKNGEIAQKSIGAKPKLALLSLLD
ncbi:MAG: thioredoxin [Clostridia bacterium]|nr:thioredoxin [Clostridia bacterium]MBR2327670.1 thioredoxin [Clostridia bacterium]